MLASLHIKNYVLIDTLDIDFPDGLVIITGQTGAGKSIMLGALSLLMGAKADASVISPDAENCVVEGEFTISGNERVRALLESLEIEGDSGNVIIRRVVNRAGRSRSFVNDCPVTLPSLVELSGHLVDVHSQHGSLLLTDRKFQLSVLDSFAGDADLLTDCGSAWKAMRSVERELAALKERAAKAESERDYNEAQYRQLCAASLKDGELDELEEEQKLLANAEQIASSLNAAASVLSGDDSNSVSGVPACLKDAARSLSAVAKYLPSLSDLSARLDSARLDIEDVLGEVEKICESSDASPERLRFVEDRIGLIYQLLKKHSCQAVSDLIALRDSLASEFSDSENLEERIVTLEQELKQAAAAYRAASSKLGEARKKAAGTFASEILSRLSFMELEHSAFDVGLSESEDSELGNDSVRFAFSSNGTRPEELSKCASGGEMSRIMLAIKSVMAEVSQMPTMIFDEIDTGVSGSVADKMGSVICTMGRTMQVIAITHLPQVAAKGEAHFVVSKNSGPDGIVRSSMTRLDGEDRVTEVARLLSGSTITPQARANARALMGDD